MFRFEFEFLTVHDFTFEEDDGVRVSNSGFEETSGIFGVIRSQNNESRNLAVPGGEALGVLSSNSS